mgnify:CR=1 FL=1
MPRRSLLSLLLQAGGAGVLAGVLAFLLHDAISDDAGAPRDYHEAVERAAPAVVSIYTRERIPARPSPDRPLFDEFFGGHGERVRSAVGSGVIVDPAGYVVTNHHVVAGKERVRVVLGDGRRVSSRLVGSDPGTDLALLRVDATGLPALAPARGRAARTGDVVLALGNGYGVGRAVTLGIVGATGRRGLGVSTFENFIQHDAAINPGNSGGPLVDAHGRLVGINTAIFSRSGGSNGVGFAIPARMVATVVRQLREHGRVVRGWLGVRTENLPGRPGPGVRVRGVFADSPAERAGLRRGDILLRLGETPLVDVDALLERTATGRPGARLDLEYRRAGESRRVQVTLGQRPGRP